VRSQGNGILTSSFPSNQKTQSGLEIEQPGVTGTAVLNARTLSGHGLLEKLSLISALSSFGNARMHCAASRMVTLRPSGSSIGSKKR
jgi:hypothetical protein